MWVGGWMGGAQIGVGWIGVGVWGVLGVMGGWIVGERSFYTIFSEEVS